MSIKHDIETGMTTVSTARKVINILFVVGVGALILGLALGGLLF